MMRVVITEHTKRRLRGLRQENITLQDIVQAAGKIPGHIPTATRFRGFFAQSGRMFDIVAKDIAVGRLVITVIGK